ncbi:MAG TPA: hypothetical protein VER33_03575, partial [Polyangiaceae bacterium]|nr:hypothetical protein [Polyangiaceae bacterium]
MSLKSTAPAGDKDRAIAALERAVVRAEHGLSEEPVVLTAPEDLATLSRADIRVRLDRVMMGAHADEGLDALLAGGVLGSLLPEVNALVGFGDGEWRHKDVWKHTKQV